MQISIKKGKQQSIIIEKNEYIFNDYLIKIGYYKKSCYWEIWEWYYLWYLQRFLSLN